MGARSLLLILNRMLISGARRLEHVINQYMEHHHTERAHQGIGNEIMSRRRQGRTRLSAGTGSADS